MTSADLYFERSLSWLYGRWIVGEGDREEEGKLLRRLLVGSVEKEWMCCKYIFGTVITKFADGSWI